MYEHNDNEHKADCRLDLPLKMPYMYDNKFNRTQQRAHSQQLPVCVHSIRCTAHSQTLKLEIFSILPNTKYKIFNSVFDDKFVNCLVAQRRCEWMLEFDIRGCLNVYVLCTTIDMNSIWRQ